MREAAGWLSLAAGVLVVAEGIRTLTVFRRCREATGKGYLGAMLAMFGASLVLRAPEIASLVTALAGSGEAVVIARGACCVGAMVGAAGLLKVSGWSWLRLRYAAAVGTGALASATVGVPDDPELRASMVWAGDVVLAAVLTVCSVRVALAMRQGGPWVRTAGRLVLAGGAVCSGGAVASLVEGLGQPSGMLGLPVLAQGIGGVLLAAGSSYSEALAFVAQCRKRREDARVRQLWRYLEPIRMTMSPRLPADGSPAKEIVDIYDSLLLARHGNDQRVRRRASLAAEAAGLSGPDCDDFVDAVELRAAVGEPRGAVAARTGAAPPLDVGLETDPLDVDVDTQRAQMGRLARLVLRNGMVRRIAK